MSADMATVLSAADVRAERARYKVSQAELAAEIGWYAQTLINIENDQVELTQQAYHDLLAAITRVAERKQESAEQAA